MKHCENCNSNFEKNYCNNCGQKIFSKEDKSVKNLIEELLHFLTHFEGTFFTTLKTLFLQPSKVSSDYCNGIRKRYFKPISLYLLVVIIYLLMPIASGLNMKMQNYKGVYLSKNLITSQIINKTTQLNISEDELAVKFEVKSEKIAKFLLFAMIPLSAIILFLLFYSKKRLVYDTIILSTELNTFFISIYFILIPITFSLLTHVFSSLKNPDDNWFTLSFYILSFLLYITTIFYKFYNQSRFISFAKAIVFVIFYTFIIIPLYRILVFETVIMLL